MIKHPAAKRHRQSVVRNIRNSVHKGRARRYLTNLQATIRGASESDKNQMLSTYYSLVDRAAKRGALHFRSAARYKSRASKALNQSNSAPDSVAAKT